MQGWLPWALLSAVFAALTAILAKAGVSSPSSSGSAVDPNVATAVRTVVVLVFAWAVALGAGGVGALRDLPARGWLFLTLSGLATGASWLCYFRALARGTAGQVAPVDKLSVPFTLVLAALVLGERLTWREWLGGSLILLGAMVIAWRPAAGP